MRATIEIWPTVNSLSTNAIIHNSSRTLTEPWRVHPDRDDKADNLPLSREISDVCTHHEFYVSELAFLPVSLFGRLAATGLVPSTF
jgi:hypothetical protein